MWFPVSCERTDIWRRSFVFFHSARASSKLVRRPFTTSTPVRQPHSADGSSASRISTSHPRSALIRLKSSALPQSSRSRPATIARVNVWLACYWLKVAKVSNSCLPPASTTSRSRCAAFILPWASLHMSAHPAFTIAISVCLEWRVASYMRVNSIRCGGLIFSGNTRRWPRKPEGHDHSVPCR